MRFNSLLQLVDIDDYAGVLVGVGAEFAERGAHRVERDFAGHERLNLNGAGSDHIYCGQIVVVRSRHRYERNASFEQRQKIEGQVAFKVLYPHYRRSAVTREAVERALKRQAGKQTVSRGFRHFAASDAENLFYGVGVDDIDRVVNAEFFREFQSVRVHVHDDRNGLVIKRDLSERKSRVGCADDDDMLAFFEFEFVERRDSQRHGLDKHALLRGNLAGKKYRVGLRHDHKVAEYAVLGFAVGITVFALAASAASAMRALAAGRNGADINGIAALDSHDGIADFGHESHAVSAHNERTGRVRIVKTALGGGERSRQHFQFYATGFDGLRPEVDKFRRLFPGNFPGFHRFPSFDAKSHRRAILVSSEPLFRFGTLYLAFQPTLFSIT